MNQEMKDRLARLKVAKAILGTKDDDIEYINRKLGFNIFEISVDEFKQKILDYVNKNK